MSRQIFTGNSPLRQMRPLDRWVDLLWFLGLLIAALTLYGLHLGGVPLRDWDEGLVAQVAREIGRGTHNWLYPTLHGVPYFNKPPLVHWLIAFAYQMGGVNEGMARLPSALLTALSVPLLYSIGLELFRHRTSAIFSALVYLTFLPVIRQGRLAMLDGTILFLWLILVWCVLRSRRDLRFALGSGLAFGLLCLTKGIFLGLLLGAIAFFFLLWDTPRLLTSPYLWLGLALGFFPVSLWYGAQWLHYGQGFILGNLFNQSLQRVWQPVENHSGPIWYYLLEILKYGWPWLLFVPQGLRLAWQNRNLSWAKLILVWTGIYFVAISVMTTKLPWYVLPIYPALALAVGRYLAEVWREGDRDIGLWKLGKVERGKHEHFVKPTPDQLVPIFILLAIISGIGYCYFGGMFYFINSNFTQIRDLQFTFGSLMLTFSFVAVLISQKDRQFLIVLFWGMYLSLLLFFTSNYWVWELNEDFPVKPVAAMIREGTPLGQEIYLDHPFGRPSLNFYSDRHIHAVDHTTLKTKWQTLDQPYFLVKANNLNKLQLNPVEKISQTPDWILITKKR
ncbi:ArnT family glycosyltransferase [Planktothrix mougeotii]|uniref:Glycosyltransferase family 39 protein n=1 Tax=Planktothrix mougeotii LEGE 06226 TaxID=1828728 RepID=A0ABR9U5R3_9CYAN|nr:glycosyltransferase family 39 protein [Planktothrix mougeotii]MBE9141789.1 glycosyltransferase family 39 protein [Planktothrix mougeotii LEGE 06226]